MILKKIQKMFHYNDSPRVIEAWKFSQNVKKLAMNKKILDILQFLYEKTNPNINYKFSKRN